MPTYYNDNDLKEIIGCQKIDEQKVISFFLKKGGKVNITNFTYVVNQYAIDKNAIYQVLADLNNTYKIKYVNSHIAKLTWKAKWERFISLKSWGFWAAISAIIAFAFNTRFQLPPLRPVEKLTGLAPHSFQSNS